MLCKHRLATAAAFGAAGALLAAGGASAAERGDGSVTATPTAACDAATGTARITVTDTGAGGTPDAVVLTVRFATGMPGPRLGAYRFPPGTAPGTVHTFHVEWLPDGQYYLYVNATPGTDAPTATIATAGQLCTVHVTGSAAPALADTGAGPDAGPLSLAGGAVLLGGAAVLLTRRRPTPR
ncbi:hypothetical protein POF50_027130 [Streptomyces sp. SL13]|uniref:LPXTG cell wall anchor domain-containing protein n=1 Tax=Streptantibioticus silvisoli TaxID=2705255 RepID=A0AA90H841_9ACTN|nr:hypothetical protein [Streptantibioticus silvisoli]MDI5972976.1 hypothetical protein [Streptantibioticus silvisoli]